MELIWRSESFKISLFGEAQSAEWSDFGQTLRKVTLIVVGSLL